MLEYRTGDLMTAEAEAVVNTVNCVGVMGRGVALQFKHAYPDNYKAYASACRRNEVQLGRMFVFETGRSDGPRYIINFPTKWHWRSRSRIQDIEAGLRALVGEIRDRGIRSIAIPPLGSGLGGLPWPEVRIRIERVLHECGNLRVIVYEPCGDRGTQKLGVRYPKVPRMTTGRAVLVSLMRRYLGGLMDPFVTLLEIHKLMYFMQQAGEKLKLDYTKGPHGPYAQNLRHVLQRIEGYMIIGFGDGGDCPDKPIELLPGAIEEANEVLGKHAKTRDRFLRVADLIEGFETSYGLELLATVHWVAQEDSATTFTDIKESTYAWNKSKQRFTRHQLRVAWDTLRNGGWIDVRSQPATEGLLFE